jgi:PAS domain S-box-containing protein
MAVTPSELAETVLHFVVRTQESVMLDDASVPNQFSADEYIRQKHSRSILCLPLVKQAKLTGVLYLENNLTAHAFTPARIAVLKLLASQAAISLENARLYNDLQGENSERKRAEDELRRSEAYLAEAQRLSLTGSFGCNVSTGEIFWSDETYRIVGLDRGSKPTLREVFQRVHPEDIARVRETLDRGIQSGIDLDFEHRLLMPDGSVKHVRVVGRPLRQDASGDLEFVGAVTDITERKQLEGQLLEGQQRFRLLAESSLTGIYLIQEGRFRYVNPVMARMFGYETEEMVDRLGPLDLTYPDDRRIVREYIRRRVEGEIEEIHYDFRGLRKDGSVFYIEVHGRRIEHAGKIGVIGTLVDITERKRAEEERQAHLWFLENMDQINRAIQGTSDLEQMMSNVLDAVLAIFNCDRAWLVYPCDPEAPSWGVPMEHTRPEFPGAFALGLDLPLDPETAKVFQTVRASSTPVRFGPASEHALPTAVAARFNMQSVIAMAVYPKGDKPYMLGLHQCSYPRVWTPQEERLFQEIGRRLEDALTSLLMFRNLGESERKLEEAQCLAHVGYWEYAPDTDLIIWSDETYRIFGLKPQAQMPNLAQLLELIHPDDRQIMVQASSSALRGGPRYDIEYRVIRPNGEVRFVHSQGDVTMVESGRPRRMFGTVQDITERKRAEQRLTLQHTVTRILAEATTFEEVTPKILESVCESLQWEVGALWSIDRHAGVLRCVEVWHGDSVNVPRFEALCRQSTFTSGIGLPGRVWSSGEAAYIPDVSADANFPRVTIAAREGLHAAFGFPILLGGEVLAVLEFFIHEVRQPEQELLNMMVTLGSQIGQFIEAKRAEEKLHKAQAELAHVTRVTTLGELTASIAHEVNQPLTAIVANANASLRWLGAATPNLDEARQAVSRIVRDGNRASDVIGRIRALVKKGESERTSLDINEAIQEVVGLTRSEIQNAGVTLKMNLYPILPPIVGDRIQLQQVILNLVMNAIDAMSTVVDRPREMLIRSTQFESDKVLVTVQDSGFGIDSQNLENIFNTFFTTKSRGMGMGLAISRSIVESHGGQLWVEPNDGPGVSFQFTLLKY